MALCRPDFRYGPFASASAGYCGQAHHGAICRELWALHETHDGSVQMIDTSVVCVHQHGGCAGGAMLLADPRRRTVPGPPFLRSEIAKTQFVLAHICTGRAIWWSASSTGSSNAGASLPGMTNSPQTTLPSSSSQPFAFGYALMSPRPSTGQSWSWTAALMVTSETASRLVALGVRSAR